MCLHAKKVFDTMKTMDIQEKRFKVKKIVYYNSQRASGVLGLKPVDDLGNLGTILVNRYGDVTACGNFIKPEENEEVIISGEVVTHDTYGKQIDIKALDFVDERKKTVSENSDNTFSKEGFIDFLAKSDVAGVDVKIAEKIYDAFGDKSLNVVTERPEDLLEIKGIGKKTVEKIKSTVGYTRKHKRTINFLLGLGLYKRIISKLIGEFGEETISIIKNNPFEILRISKELSFKQVDLIYLKNNGDPKAPIRLENAFLYLLKQQATMEGSTGCLRDTLSKKFYTLLNISGSEDYFGNTMDSLEKDGKIVLGKGVFVYYKEYLEIEKEIANKILSLKDIFMPSKKIKEYVVEEEIKNFPFELNKQQVKAIKECLDSNISVISGPAGCLTGDTIIKYNRAKTAREGKLKNMYTSFHKAPVKGSNGWDRSISTKVRSYISSENRVKLNDVEDIVYSGKKDVYCLTLADGKTLKATADHQVMTKDGFVQLKNLKKGSLVMVENFIWKEKNGVGRGPFKTQEVSVGKFHPYAKKTYHKDIGCTYYSLKIHRAIYEANMNGVSLEEFREGCKSPNSFKFIDPSVYHIHHIDHDHWNNDINNLTVMPRKEHYKEHAKGAYSHFKQGVPEFSSVVSVDYIGVEDTYDICCYKDHNFVANGMIVHNSGKSSITKALYRIYTRCGFNVVLLSATAKACRRLEECTGGVASTIHRFLKLSKEGDSFFGGNYEKDTVLIIDEASMMDIMLFNYLLKGATMSTRILLVGDNNQLPSVQAGNVLGDVIDSGKVHVSLLTDIMRQQENSNIIRYCSMINEGKIFEPCESSDFLYEEFGTADELKEKLLSLYVKEVNEVGLNEVQVIAPYKKGEVGMDNLNMILQQTINGSAPEVLASFRVGDKVRHTENNYKKDVYNGETGVVTEFDSEKEIINVDYGYKVISYNKSDIDELKLSYASTVHSSQGSEYKIVFVILDDTSVNNFLHIRRLLYTAVSRGKSKVYILTKPYLVDNCIKNNSYRPRITKLKDFLEGKYD